MGKGRATEAGGENRLARESIRQPGRLRKLFPNAEVIGD
jgi:hypothetical protein